jgi:hypothetical protein
MTTRFILAMLAALSAVVAVAGDDAQNRDRAARAALALAQAKPKPKPKDPTAAPAPRPKPMPYPAAYQFAVEKEQVLVAFVGCRGKHPTPDFGHLAVVATAPELPGYQQGSIIVGFPTASGTINVHGVYDCEQHDSDVLREAVRQAGRKSGFAPIKSEPPAPRPLRWEF